MEEILSIFKNDAFSATTLERVAAKVPYQPQALGALNIFDNRPIRTTTVEIYYDEKTQSLVPTSERGSPEPLPKRDAGKIHLLRTVRLAERDRINAAELQDVISLPLGSASQLAAAQREVGERVTRLRSDNELTLEHMRLGALQGKLIDADGSVITNYFDEFNIAEPATINIDFSAIAEADLVEFFTSNVVRPIMRALGGRKSNRTYIAALVGDVFWARLTSHAAVRETFRGTAAMQALMQNNTGQPGTAMGNAWGEFRFAGIRFMNYMGTDDGSTVAVAPEMAHFFPVGAQDVFRTFWAPGESMRDINTRGRMAYVIVQPDPETQKNEWVDVYYRNYPLFACIYPGALLKMQTTG